MISATTAATASATGPATAGSPVTVTSGSCTMIISHLPDHLATFPRSVSGAKSSTRPLPGMTKSPNSEIRTAGICS